MSDETEVKPVADGEFGVGIQPNPKARYWQERAEFWRAQAVALGWREKRDAENGEAQLPMHPVSIEALVGNWSARAKMERDESRNKEWAEWLRENHRGAASAFAVCARELSAALAAKQGGEP